jgi:hypothetical protein
LYGYGAGPVNMANVCTPQLANLQEGAECVLRAVSLLFVLTPVRTRREDEDGCDTEAG